jgi:nucleotide-binding universal stress UspA family protein
MSPFTRIIVAVDFSAVSHDVLHYAVQVSRLTGAAQLDVVHVVPDPQHQAWTVEAVGIDVDRMRRKWVDDARQQLATLIAAEGFGGAAATPIVLVGRAAETIAEHAAARKADLIVMGTHGYGPVKRLVLGSVADRVVRQASCPVLTIPHDALIGSADRVPAVVPRARA